MHMLDMAGRALIACGRDEANGAKLSDCLAGQLATNKGWIARFSKA